MKLLKPYHGLQPHKVITRKPALKTFKKDSTVPVDDIRDAVTKLKRERIIATASELFNENGLNNTTLFAVAAKMNVTKPFIYTHFKSKNELLAEICSRGISASLNVLDSVVASEGSSTEKLRVFTREFMLAVIDNQSHIAIYTREEKNLQLESKKTIQKMRRTFDHKFCVLLERGVSDGEFQISDVQLTALSICGLISWSYVWYRPDGRLSKKETADHVAELVLAMVKTKR